MSEVGDAIEHARVTGLRALVFYGPASQIDKMNEECGELITALARFKHGRATHADVLEELADVVIVAMQLGHVFDNKAEPFQAVIERKRERLAQRLRGEAAEQ